MGRGEKESSIGLYIKKSVLELEDMKKTMFMEVLPLPFCVLNVVYAHVWLIFFANVVFG